MTDSRKPEDPTFSTEMTDQQRTKVSGETPRGAKQEQGASPSQEYIEEHVERDSTAGLLDPGGPKEVDQDGGQDKK